MMTLYTQAINSTQKDDKDMQEETDESAELEESLDILIKIVGN